MNLTEPNICGYPKALGQKRRKNPLDLEQDRRQDRFPNRDPSMIRWMEPPSIRKMERGARKFNDNEG